MRATGDIDIIYVTHNPLSIKGIIVNETAYLYIPTG